jgi:predicted dehydrogenase
MSSLSKAGVRRAGVIGAGVFGGYHAAKWSNLAGVRLAAVLDADPVRAAAVAARHGAGAFESAESFLEAVDIVSIASPAATHASWAMAALAAGKPVYVEKPLATDLDAADAIAAAARRRGLVVACGFLERIVLTTSRLAAAPERPVRFETVRRGVASTRNLDVSVVLDLMIHDLDLALSLCDGEPFAVEAEGERIANASADVARAEVSFDSGFSASFEVSRVAEAPERRLRIVYPSGEVRIDLISGVLENTTGHDFDTAFAAAPAAKDRLAASLATFLAAAKGDAPRPIADARDGVRALDLALAVQHALGE